jgi:transcriptional regulator with XRE-family HTH domain
MTWHSLRLRRFGNRVTKREMAQRLGCAESWVNSLELGHYQGPAREKWAEPYETALDELIAARKAAR